MFGWFKKAAEPDELYLEGEGDFDFDIVGEASYQDALASIAGEKDEESKEVECQAVLVCEPENPYDKNAVAVYIAGEKVGYLARVDAVAFQREMKKRLSVIPHVRVDAIIVGGWSRPDSEGLFGVKLDF